MRDARSRWSCRPALAVLCALLAVWFEIRPPHLHDFDPLDGQPDFQRASGPCCACVAASALPVAEEPAPLVPEAIQVPAAPPLAGVYPRARQLLLRAPKQGPPVA